MINLSGEKMTKRFERYLLDGGFWFDDYIKPVWAIKDSIDKNSPISHLEFKDEYKDLCDEVVNYLNSLYEENQKLNKENKKINDKFEVTREQLKEARKLNSLLFDIIDGMIAYRKLQKTGYFFDVDDE